LPHPVAEPSLYVPVDLGVKVLQTLLAGCVHAKLSLLVPADAAMRPSCPPEVKVRPLDERQSHLTSLTSNALISGTWTKPQNGTKLITLKKHHGRAEAALLAAYGAKQLQTA
jgi:hypothetical protein